MGYRILMIYSFLLLSFVSCRKPIEDTHENEPVPIQLTASVWSSVSLDTKAPILSWSDNTSIRVFGLMREADGYHFDDPFNIVNHEAVVSSQGTVDLYPGDNATMPYFYSEGYVYDFYGYCLSGIDDEKVTNERYDKKAYSLDVEFDGSNDLLYAVTNRYNDLEKYGVADLADYDLYSATSARKGLHPALEFHHALTRFKFVVQGKGENYDLYRITGLDLEAVCSGTLILGKNAGFEPSDKITEVSLKWVDDKPFKPTDIKTDEITLGDNSSIMVAPGSKTVKVTLNLINRADPSKVLEYSFTVYSSTIPIPDGKGGQSFSSVFLPGRTYTIGMVVYEPEKIEIYSDLEDWISSEDNIEVDPDNYDKPSLDPDSPKDGDIETGVSVGDYGNGGDLGEGELIDSDN